MDLDAIIRSQHGVCSTGKGGAHAEALRGRDVRPEPSGRGVPARSRANSAGQTVLDLADVAGVEWREAVAVAVAARWVQERRTTAESLAEALEGRARHRHRPILRVALGVVAEGAESKVAPSQRRLSEGGARTGGWPSRPFTRGPSPRCAPAT